MLFLRFRNCNHICNRCIESCKHDPAGCYLEIIIPHFIEKEFENEVAESFSDKPKLIYMNIVVLRQEDNGERKRMGRERGIVICLLFLIFGCVLLYYE